MLPPNETSVDDVERGKTLSMSSSTNRFSSTFTSPEAPNTTYFASILKKERQGTLPVYEHEEKRASLISNKPHFDVFKYRQDLAASAAKRRRKFNLIAAVVVAFALLACAGTLALILACSRRQ
ncbi:uncharacterized protein CTRU02_209023 [Colletotrichum truncatum]|uniref:Uncharacterized protein n=1 Tax=Colletotrichum truncatum TaxID=5467 RepID=A0ACC3YXX8_COLTU